MNVDAFTFLSVQTIDDIMLMLHFERAINLRSSKSKSKNSRNSMA